MEGLVKSILGHKDDKDEPISWTDFNGLSVPDSENQRRKGGVQIQNYVGCVDIVYQTPSAIKGCRLYLEHQDVDSLWNLFSTPDKKALLNMFLDLAPY